MVDHLRSGDMSAEIVAAGRSDAVEDQRAQSVVERCGKRSRSHSARRRTRRFNGAAPRTVRKSGIRPTAVVPPRMLQRSRTANGAENTWWLREHYIPQLSFNGAAPRTVRKTEGPPGPTGPQGGFNGAAPRTVRKIRDQCPELHQGNQASTEPHRERCGKCTIFPGRSDQS